MAHWWLGILFSDLLPMDFGIITLTPTLNTCCMILWPLALIALGYFAWIRKDPRALAGSRPSPVAARTA